MLEEVLLDIREDIVDSASGYGHCKLDENLVFYSNISNLFRTLRVVYFARRGLGRNRTEQTSLPIDLLVFAAKL